MRHTIEIKNGITRHPLFRMNEPVNLMVEADEQIAIVGPNGSGKSRLTDIIIGKLPLLMNEVHYDFTPSPYKLVSDNIKYITFRDSYGDSDSTYYYQQRWNQHDIDDSMPTVHELLEQAFQTSLSNQGFGMDEDGVREAQVRKQQLKDKLYDLFHLDALLDKKIIFLSSGELRKFQLTRALFADPRILILDNPFIGLDAATRSQLKELLKTLVRDIGLQIIMVLSRPEDIPEFITHVVPVEHLTVLPKMRRADYCQTFVGLESAPDVLSNSVQELMEKLPEGPVRELPQDGTPVLEFDQVSIRYGQRTILKDLSWTVKQGEKWALEGENGSGKSTLLSLVCADNPQAYACNISLFGRKRGTGESIWDIKKHIGYVSPEMHRAYLKDLPSIDIVASGLNDSVGLYVRPKPEQREICEAWMSVFGIGDLADRTFLKLSSGEQRLCLLARAFVKDPDLLILDEPLHGLDQFNRILVKNVITAFCSRPHKTLVMVSHYSEDLPEIIQHHLVLKKSL